ncbi:unnamed protein product [Allacma fusca]|uniref:Protein CR006 P-loop domain-containing protein n=1 Tax=Allacma fusca TaxID=39272 RepID=A0A8J2NKS4_9HEXA|nr:unnamed protein product [Allacma fusca]
MREPWPSKMAPALKVCGYGDRLMALLLRRIYMLRSIDEINDFGVYKKIQKSDGYDDFKIKNIIYGWNYSGKTTLSRIFSSIEDKKIHPDFSLAKFKISLNDDSVLKQSELSTSNLIIKVFNTDYVAKNLRWDDSDVEPIIILGDDEIVLEQKIKSNQDKIDRTKELLAIKERSSSNLEATLSSLRTSNARNIKETLQLVETFTATQAINIYNELTEPEDSYILSEDDFRKNMKLSLSKISDKKQNIPTLVYRSKFEERVEKVNNLLKEKPEVSHVINWLSENTEISSWVEKGLSLHSQENECLFCTSQIPEGRIDSLKAHYSRSLLDYRSEITQVSLELEKEIIDDWGIQAGMFYEENCSKVDEILSGIKIEVEENNKFIKECIAYVDIKSQNPYIDCKPLPPSGHDKSKLRELISSLNEIISSHNEINANFTASLIKAKRSVQHHMLVESFRSKDYTSSLEKIKFNKIVIERCTKFIKHLRKNNEKIEEVISNGHKGCASLNDYISEFLGHNNLKIKVVKNNGVNRFNMLRLDQPAKNLSDGEKSAIAFSFYLTKLKEEKDLSSIIIYIDDPISSLDSNHIFQVNSIIKNTFFIKHPDQGWGLTYDSLSFILIQEFQVRREIPLTKEQINYLENKNPNGY